MGVVRYGLMFGVALLSSYAQADVEHQVDWGGRSRYANIADENSGQAASLLLRATLDSHWNDVISSSVEVDHVNTAFKDDHSDGVRLNEEPLIPDPPGTEINQAFIAITLDNIRANLGRQTINFDNQRFVGGNGFWQNEQTFDAAFVSAKLASNSSFTYAYLANANRIFGDDADKNNPGTGPYANNGDDERPAAFLGDHEHNSHLARLEWNEWDYTRVIAYGYRIDNRDMPSASNNTLGASYNLNYKHNSLKYRVQLEAAQQNRYEIQADGLNYYLLELGLGINSVEINTHYEILGANEGAAFITPLGSNHNFEGWAGEIGNTPNTGVRDLSLGILWRASPFRIESSYHYFREDESSNTIGREFDLDIAYRPARKHSISLRFASFEPETASGNIRKVYLDYSYNL